jgi:hypothetical protein
LLHKLGECRGCGQERYIINRTHYLCQPCNYERLHGKGSVERKQQEYTEKLRRGSNPISKKSDKQKVKDKELAKVYAEMERTRPQLCTGCGCGTNLSHSHIIPRSWSDALEVVPENITYHCLVRPDGSTGCHTRWESVSERIFLNDYAANMTFIKRVEPEYYWQIFYKEKDLGLR